MAEETQENTSELPSFFAPSAEETTSQSSQDKPLFKRFLYIFGGFWVLATFIYFQFFYGFSNLSALLPADFTAFLAGFFIFPIIIFLLSAFFYKVYTSARQNEVVEGSLRRFLQTNDENLLSKIINKALKTQISELNATLQFLSAQTDLLKTELNTKAADFESVSQTLKECFSNNLLQLEQDKSAYFDMCRQISQEAGKTAEVMANNSVVLTQNAKSVGEALNPLIDELMATAEHLKSILSGNREYIEQTKTDLDIFTQNARQNMENLSEMLSSQNAKLEKSFLQTADGCEDVYKRIDSGISHIENSLKTHKDLAAEQSRLIDKNSTFLDQKLGEYGKLINMEVAAMVERSSTLENNVKKQLKSFKEAAENIGNILDVADSNLEQKSGRTIQNIQKVINNLEKELSKLNSFADKTENKNAQMQAMAEKITTQMGALSEDLSLKVEDLKLRAVEAIDKFNEVSGTVEKNTLQLSETASVIEYRSQAGSDAILNSEKQISKSIHEFQIMKDELQDMGKNLDTATQKSAELFELISQNMEGYRQELSNHFEELENQKIRSEKHLAEFKDRYQNFGLSRFMDLSQSVLEKLENLSIDINRFFDDKSEDDLWKKFYNGDHAAFARHIAKYLDRKNIIKIRDSYEKNQDFHQLADSYLREFETLVKAAENSEASEKILAMLSGSDIGKVYYIISKALDKIN